MRTGRQLAEERIVDYILPLPRKKSRAAKNPLEFLLGQAADVRRAMRNWRAEQKYEENGEIIRRKYRVLNWIMMLLK